MELAILPYKPYNFRPAPQGRAFSRQIAILSTSKKHPKHPSKSQGLHQHCVNKQSNSKTPRTSRTKLKLQRAQNNTVPRDRHLTLSRPYFSEIKLGVSKIRKNVEWKLRSSGILCGKRQGYPYSRGSDTW